MKMYEIDVGGPVGPLVRAALPAFTTRAVPIITVLSGTVNDPESLRRVLDLLEHNALCTLDIWVSTPEDVAE